MTPLQAILGVVGLWIAWDLMRYVRSGSLRRHSVVFVRRPARQWAGAVVGSAVAIALVVGVAVSLVQVWPSVMGFTWLKLLATPADGPIEGQNLIVAPARIPWIGFAFLVLLVLNVPRLARREEEVFRRRTQGWPDGLTRSVKFGLLHCLVGIPIGWGLGLTVAGLWFTWNYFRGGVRQAWFAHVVYNLMLLTALAVWLVGL